MNTSNNETDYNTPAHTLNETTEVIVCGPPESPDPDLCRDAFYDTVTICGSPASPDSEATDSDSLSVQSSRSSLDSDSSVLPSGSPRSPVRNYMLEPYNATPTTAHKRIIRRRLNFNDINLIYDLSDISDDERVESDEPVAKRTGRDDEVSNNGLDAEWVNDIVEY